MDYLKRIKEIRLAHGDTQAKTANKLKMSQQQWQKYEVGKNELPLRYLVAFCKEYQVSSDYILGIDF